MDKLLEFLSNNATKLVGYITVALGFIAVADPALIGDTLGGNWQKWALLISGILTAVRGHQSTAAEKAAKQGGFARVALMAILALGSLAAVTQLSGCAAIGVPHPQTFSERLAFAYTTHTAIQNAAAASLDAKDISRADALHVLKLADESRTILDAARLALDTGDPRTAEGRLALATSILIQLQTYLRNRGDGV